MKIIYFIRHAKSSWEEITSDHDRMLNPRGFKDADNVGLYLKKKEIKVDAVFSSSANRAATTARIVCENLGIPLSSIKTSEKLYDFDGTFVTKYLKALSNDLESIMIFGHNPCFQKLVNTMGTQLFVNLPTCAVVGIQFPVDAWDAIAQGETIFTLVPKELRESYGQ